MAKGCNVATADRLYTQGEEFCHRFCEDSGAYCDGPGNPAGCTVCLSSEVAILHRKVSLGPCQQDPEEPYIGDGQCVPSEYVVMSGKWHYTDDTCVACVALEGHPCLDEYWYYRQSLELTGIYFGPPICCVCA